MFHACLVLFINDVHFFVADWKSFTILFWKIIWERQWLFFVLWELNFNVLEGVVDGVVALKVEETGGRTHGTDWGDKSDSFAAVVEVACGLGFDCEGDFLDRDVFARIGRVDNGGVGVSDH